MKRLNILLIALFMLFAVANVYSQGNSEGKGKAHEKIMICHNGNLIEVNMASIPAHRDHGDTRAIWNPRTQEWMCPPCRPDGPPPEPKLCGDIRVRAIWDLDKCKWVFPDCEDVAPPEPPDEEPPPAPAP